MKSFVTTGICSISSRSTRIYVKVLTVNRREINSVAEMFGSAQEFLIHVKCSIAKPPSLLFQYTCSIEYSDKFTRSKKRIQDISHKWQATIRQYIQTNTVMVVHAYGGLSFCLILLHCNALLHSNWGSNPMRCFIETYSYQANGSRGHSSWILNMGSGIRFPVLS